jgi:hypothetical protein
LTVAARNGTLQAPKQKEKNSQCANFHITQKPNRFARLQRIEPDRRGSMRVAQVSFPWVGQSGWAFLCAAGILAGGGRLYAMPSKTLRFPVPKSPKYDHAPCPSCACKLVDTWDVYFVELDLRGEITPVKLGIDRRTAGRFHEQAPPGLNARVVLLWPHALTLFPDGMPSEQEAAS